MRDHPAETILDDRERRQYLEAVRSHIDALDQEILEKLALRAALAREAAEMKEGLGLPKVDSTREQELATAWSEAAREYGLAQGPTMGVLGSILLLTRGELVG